MRLVGLLALLLACSGCLFRDAAPVVSSGERYSTSAEDDYRLGAGDRIRITVYNEQNLSGEFTVGAEGQVSLPLIGGVPAEGRSVDDVVAAARARYADGYLRTPRLSGEVVTYRPFFILGEVSSPGLYPYTVGLTALNAVATAKGFTPRADKTTIHIRRKDELAEQAYRATPDLRIYPGDTVRVGERFF